MKNKSKKQRVTRKDTSAKVSNHPVARMKKRKRKASTMRLTMKQTIRSPDKMRVRSERMLNKASKELMKRKFWMPMLKARKVITFLNTKLTMPKEIR